MLRSVIEGVTYALRDSVEIINSLDINVRSIRATGGGAKSAFWRQLQADILGKKVVSMAADEGPAFGVALLAAVGAGEFKNVAEACKVTIKTNTETKPNAKVRKAYDKSFPIYQQIYQSLKDDFRAISELG